MDDSARRAARRSLVDTMFERLGLSPSPRERAAIQQLLHDARGVSPEIRAPALKDLTVLLVDLRGFSSLAAHWDSRTLVKLLQPFLVRMTEIVHDHGGFVDKFLGDGVMALFGAPEPHVDHTQRALRCAAEMQCATDELNRRGTGSDTPQLFVGIAVNSGEVMTGSFGSTDYREYTVVGDAVNLAARMEKFALRGEVLLSERCYLAAREDIEIAGRRQLHLRGFDEAVTAYALKAVCRPRRIEVPAIEQRTSPRVPVSLPLRYRLLDDQRLLSDEHDGRIIDIGYGGMLAKLAAPLPKTREISFEFASQPTAPRRRDLHARALEGRPGDPGRVPFAFTRMEPQDADAVRRYVDQILAGA